ncbi:MerR family transcriptional regulator [Rhodococcus hoagii]|uniref:MerR family transcriptional regulator n=1 Tax=Rhodococcus hoagii TaxID=43767 RepID=UPI0009BDDD97|nr:MerR family transcriptional regulator [Prescottella equi]NKR78467.1 MerR family transcriptional regulator [Prescottella equi]NKS03275.1 MerR family transcriptional regulator [Prescottella equi]NKS67009.1 MerR family transcriptional regulator [Prescottella equi]NKT02961.1 MerR family transcriptional regulator [Prescottella equi]
MHTKGDTHIPPKSDSNSPDAAGPGDKFDDEDFPAYSMGRAAEILGVTQAFLRSLDTAKLITPLRSGGGHRRYSRYQLRIAARARELIDQGTPIEAACRILVLEDQLSEAQRINTELRRAQQHPSEAAERDSTTD